METVCIFPALTEKCNFAQNNESMKFTIYITLLVAGLLFFACGPSDEEKASHSSTK